MYNVQCTISSPRDQLYIVHYTLYIVSGARDETAGGGEVGLLSRECPCSQLQHRIPLQTADNVLVEHRVLHPADGGHPFAAILGGAAAMENHLIRGGVVNEDVTVVINAARGSQFDVNMRVFAQEISKLGLVQSVVHIVAKNGDLHPGGHRFQQDQCLQTDVVVDDMDCFLSVGIYFGIGDVGLNGLTVIE